MYKTEQQAYVHLPEQADRHLILGTSPCCHTENSLQTQPSDKRATCIACPSTFPDRYHLTRSQSKVGNKLDLVKIERHRYWEEGFSEYRMASTGVTVFSPNESRIPYSPLIITFLNAALLTRFRGLKPCFAAEGGVEGKNKGVVFELRNASGRIGLHSELLGYLREKVPDRYDPYLGIEEVINFYEVLIRRLFEEPFSVKDRTYRAGEIFRTHSNNMSPHNTYQIVTDAITSFKGEKFTKRVIKKITDEASHPFGGVYLRGMNDNEIIEMFVPPPGF